MRKLEELTLGDLGRVVTGRTPPSSRPDLLGDRCAFITPTDIDEGSIYPKPQRRLSEVGEAEHRKILLPPNSVCFTCIASIGKMCLTREVSITNQQINAIVVEGERFDPRWVYYKLRDMRGEIAAMASGSATPIINKTSFSNIRISVPPIDTQRHLASILGAYDDLIEVNRRRVALLEAMALGLFEEWFVRFRFPGHENHKVIDTPDGPVPEGWRSSTLGELANIQWGDTATTKSAYRAEGFLAYSASGPDGFMDHFDVDRVGVVISAIGAQCGKTWLARGRWSCIKNTMRFWSETADVSTEYLFLATLGIDKWPRRGAAQPFISLGDARRIRIVAPSIDVSERFSAAVSKLLGLIDTINHQNTKLASSRDLLLPRLVSSDLLVTAKAPQLEALG